jgi:hypothetical protein
MLLIQISDALYGAFELVLLARGHHHPASDRIEGVCCEPRADSDGVAEEEVEKHVVDYLLGEGGLEGVVEAEVYPPVYHHEHTRNDKPAVHPP